MTGRRPPLKVAIMSFAHLHAMSYAKILAGLAARGEVEVRASDQDHAERVGESGGAELAATLGVDYVPDYDALLGWGPDAVLVCTENTRHRLAVEAAASVAAHVLCEKPLATNPTDAAAMIDACVAAGVTLMVAHPVRFSPVFGALRSAVAAGAFGELVAISGTNNGRLPIDQRRWFVDPLLAGGGAVTDHSVHLLDLLDALTGGEPLRSVHAVAHRLLYPELAVETAGLVSVQTRSGLPGTFDCSWSRPENSPTWGGLTLQVIGTAGIADLDAFSGRVAGDALGRGSLWLPYGPDLDAAMIDHFLTAVRTGSPVEPDGASGLRTVTAVTSAYASISSGQPEPVVSSGLVP